MFGSLFDWGKHVYSSIEENTMSTYVSVPEYTMNCALDLVLSLELIEEPEFTLVLIASCELDLM
jgi:hypothetical protein